MTTTIQELEIKILEIDRSELAKKFKKLGAMKTLDAITYIYCFDVSKQIDFSYVPKHLHEVIHKAKVLTQDGKSLRQQNFHLRARRQANHYEFTLKYHTSQTGNFKKEIEVNVELTAKDWRNIRRDLFLAGLHLVANQEKKRISYELEGEDMHFDIDTWPRMPTYMEIEGPSEAKINEYIHRLGLENHATTNLSGEDLFKKYNLSFYSTLTF